MPYRTPEPKSLPTEDPWEEVYDSIDKEIYSFCKALHYLGYPVAQSCAGHPKSKERKKGFVEFEERLLPEEKREVLELAESYGISRPRFRFFPKVGETFLYFDPVGISDSVIGEEAELGPSWKE